MTATTYVIPDGVDNGNGTWASQSLTDNGNGTWTDTSGDRDIDVTASPIYSGWQVMGTTSYPAAAGNINADNGYSASPTSVGVWAAASLINQWATGPTWIQES